MRWFAILGLHWGPAPLTVAQRRVRKQQFIYFAICFTFLTVCFRTSAQASSDYDTLVHQGNAQLQAGSNDLALATANSAIKLNAARWEAYALAGGALMNLTQYEEAADDFSHAIDRAPEAKQHGLRDLRRQCLIAESGSVSGPAPAVTPAEPAPTTQAEIVLWKSIENSSNQEDFQTYLNQYPRGAFAALAQRHLGEIAETEKQRAKEQAAANEAEEKKNTWTDPETHLMWTRSDNGTDTNWQQAVDYCKNMKLAGYADWRLPTLDELKGVYDKSKDMPKRVTTYPVRGDLQLSGIYEWSGTQVTPSKTASVFCYFYHPAGSEAHKLNDNFRDRVLCVRDSGN